MTTPAADLHAQIMNLPCKPYDGTDAYTHYCQGHRDARHAAAELVSAASPAASPSVLRQAMEALDYVIRDLEMRADMKLGDDKGLVDIGNGAYTQAKDALSAIKAALAPSGASTTKEGVGDLKEALKQAVAIIDGALYCGHQLSDNGQTKLDAIRKTLATSALRSELAAVPQQPAVTGVQFDLNTKEAETLKNLIGEDDCVCQISLSVGNGHAGPGLYAWQTEYPEEGATFLQAAR